MDTTSEQKSTTTLITELRAMLESGHWEAGDLVARVQQLLDALRHVPPCAVKLKPGETGFTLRAQEVTSDLAVIFWARINAILHHLMEAGLSVDQALGEIESRMNVHFSDFPDDCLTEKLRNAMNLAEHMSHYPNRKVAD